MGIPPKGEGCQSTLTQAKGLEERVGRRRRRSKRRRRRDNGLFNLGLTISSSCSTLGYTYITSAKKVMINLPLSHHCLTHTTYKYSNTVCFWATPSLSQCGHHLRISPPLLSFFSLTWCICALIRQWRGRTRRSISSNHLTEWCVGRKGLSR